MAEGTQIECGDSCELLPLESEDTTYSRYTNLAMELIPGYKSDVPQVLTHAPEGGGCGPSKGYAWLDIQYIPAVDCIFHRTTYIELQRVRFITFGIQDADPCTIRLVSCDGTSMHDPIEVPEGGSTNTGEDCSPLSSELIPAESGKSIRYFNSPIECFTDFNSLKPQVMGHSAAHATGTTLYDPGLSWFTLDCFNLVECLTINKPDYTGIWDERISAAGIVIPNEELRQACRQVVSVEVIPVPPRPTPTSTTTPRASLVIPNTPSNTPTPTSTPVWPPGILPPPLPSQIPGGGGGGPGIPITPSNTPTNSPTKSTTPSNTPTISYSASPTPTKCTDCELIESHIERKESGECPEGFSTTSLCLINNYRYLNLPAELLPNYKPDKVQILTHNTSCSPGNRFIPDHRKVGFQWSDVECINVITGVTNTFEAMVFERKKVTVLRSFVAKDGLCSIQGMQCPGVQPTPTSSPQVTPTPTPSPFVPEPPGNDDPIPPYTPPFPVCDCPIGYEKQTGDPVEGCGVCCPIGWQICTQLQCQAYGMCVPPHLFATLCGNCDGGGGGEDPPAVQCPPLSTDQPENCGINQEWSTGNIFFNTNATIIESSGAIKPVPVLNQARGLKVNITVTKQGDGQDCFAEVILLDQNNTPFFTYNVPEAEMDGKSYSHCACTTEQTTSVRVKLRLRKTQCNVDVRDTGCCGPVHIYVVGLTRWCPNGWTEQYVCNNSFRICCPQGYEICKNPTSSAYGMCVSSTSCGAIECNGDDLTEPNVPIVLSCDQPFNDTLGNQAGFGITQKIYDISPSAGLMRLSWNFTGDGNTQVEDLYGQIRVSIDGVVVARSFSDYQASGSVLFCKPEDKTEMIVTVDYRYVECAYTLECLGNYCEPVSPTLVYAVRGCPEGWRWIYSFTTPNNQLGWACCPDGWWLCMKEGPYKNKCIPPAELALDDYCGQSNIEPVLEDPPFCLDNQNNCYGTTDNFPCEQDDFTEPAANVDSDAWREWIYGDPANNANPQNKLPGYIRYEIIFKNTTDVDINGVKATYFGTQTFDPFTNSPVYGQPGYTYDLSIGKKDGLKVVFPVCKSTTVEAHKIELHLPAGISATITRTCPGICPLPQEVYFVKKDQECPNGWENNGSYLANDDQEYVYCCPIGWFICLDRNSEFFGMCVPTPGLTSNGQLTWCI